MNNAQENKLSEAHEFYAAEHTKYRLHFDHEGCIEDIHRIYGNAIATAVHNAIATDIPELGLKLIEVN